MLCNFLNPLHNRRTDRWGVSLANRARILVEIGAGRALPPRGQGAERGGDSDAH
ncbi:hypothetical protein ACSZNY_09045 [Aeromonas caviae]